MKTAKEFKMQGSKHPVRFKLRAKFGDFTWETKAWLTDQEMYSATRQTFFPPRSLSVLASVEVTPGTWTKVKTIRTAQE